MFEFTGLVVILKFTSENFDSFVAELTDHSKIRFLFETLKISHFNHVPFHNHMSISQSCQSQSYSVDTNNLII